MPKCIAEYLVLLFYEAGLCEQGINGAVTLSWKEINSWLDATKRSLSPWEVNMIRDMSKEYVSELHSASDKYRPMPFSESEETINTDSNADMLSSFFDGLISENK